MSLSKKTAARYRSIDSEIAQVAKSIRILTTLSWGESQKDTFLKTWRTGKKELPTPHYNSVDFSDQRRVLEKIVRSCKGDNALETFFRETSISYLTATRMLSGIGTAQFLDSSIELYGSPHDTVLDYKQTHLNIAKSILQSTKLLIPNIYADNSSQCILAETVAVELKAALDALFTEHPVRVEIDNELSAKAAAGSERVRIRASTCFSKSDIDQLREHECFVHSLTAINGKLQPNLLSLGLGAPRTTRTQEGLALFAEFITHSIDLYRLRRIALRVVSIALAIDGANFNDIFSFFLEHGMSEEESFHSTARVFRGGDVRGGIVFTKDCTYLGGLIEVHLYLRSAIEAGKPELIQRLLAGRFMLSDVDSLFEYFESGFIAGPRYTPTWAEDLPGLAAFLVYSNTVNCLGNTTLELDDFE